ncbi:MAG: sensor histidine kinase N-terminal domain-containing protein [Pseudomonadota bacterium]
MAARSLRGQLLRLLLAPVAALLALGAVAVYFVSLEPASEAYDQALADIALALAERIRASGDRYAFDLPGAADRALRTDRYDTIYYQVRAPDGTAIAGDAGLPDPPPGARAQDGVIRYDARYRGSAVHVVAMLVPCAGRVCTVQVAETGNKRRSLARAILFTGLVPELLVAAAALAAVWFGVKRGLAPLEALSAEIKARSARDLRPLDAADAPLEVQPLANALNHLLGRVAEAAENQRRFIANAAHQLRTPLAGLQAHTELALAHELPAACRAELEQVHRATIRTARLANQLLALARAEPGGWSAERFAPLDLRAVVEEAADEWVHRALARGIDLGFELAPAPVRGDALLLREALANLVHNAIEYAGSGARVTVRSGVRQGASFLEVEDDGPGIAPAERERVLERFYRVPGTPGEGSGLGLAIVREIALAHGAALEVGAGAAGQGCRVALRFARA